MKMSSFNKSSSGNKNFPHDIKTQSGLTALFNERVISSQPVERPLEGPGGGKFGQGGIAAANFVGIKTSYSGKNDRATHSGSLVTTSDGKQYLVHKGDGFGKSSNTVVTDAKHMSSKWKPAGPTTNVAGRASISDFVKAGGKDYNVRGKIATMQPVKCRILASRVLQSTIKKKKVIV